MIIDTNTYILIYKGSRSSAEILRRHHVSCTMCWYIFAPTPMPHVAPSGRGCHPLPQHCGTPRRKRGTATSDPTAVQGFQIYDDYLASQPGRKPYFLGPRGTRMFLHQTAPDKNAVFAIFRTFSHFKAFLYLRIFSLFFDIFHVGFPNPCTWWSTGCGEFQGGGGETELRIDNQSNASPPRPPNNHAGSELRTGANTRRIPLNYGPEKHTSAIKRGV